MQESDVEEYNFIDQDSAPTENLDDDSIEIEGSDMEYVHTHCNEYLCTWTVLKNFLCGFLLFIILD